MFFRISRRKEAEGTYSTVVETGFGELPSSHPRNEQSNKRTRGEVKVDLGWVQDDAMRQVTLLSLDSPQEVAVAGLVRHCTVQQSNHEDSTRQAA